MPVSLGRRGARRPLLPFAALLFAVALVLPGSLSPASSAERGQARISLTPTKYIAGEYLTITGNIGTTGQRKIVLQRFMRDRYLDAGTGKTDARGNFRFRVRGPGMATPFSVFAPSLKKRTPQAPVVPVEQSFDISFSPAPALGQQTTVRVAVSPARAGRAVTLLRRLTPTSWTTAGSGVTDAQGVARFAITPDAAGEIAYRAVAGAMKSAGISAFPSFPEYVTVAGSARTASAPARGAANTSDVAPAPRAARAPYTQPGPIHAGNTFGWWPLKWVWDWEYGEALAPWREYSSGTGRAAVGWAMLTVDSGPTGRGWDNVGTTRATLGGSGEKYGRWEIRMRVPNWPSGPNYRVKAELIPASTANGACSNQTITMADFEGYENTVDLGVTNGTGSWAHTVGGVVKNRDNWHTYAVEVTKNRVTWFVDAKVSASIKNTAAVSGQPLTMRLSLIAPDETTQMRHTRIGVDWARFWTLDKKGTAEKQIKKAPAPTAGRDISC
ncbi:glycoside hydrolase family 16 protein [Nocardioides sp. R-C-SC26]|uniref:glycoside hydrolase family 16 protein n=1 Tax=Nocardioides sp. R-C-SC26 TaxID=2870414 RepID=UPI001E37731D|nr:glycoside hydrolase family 16 protein [Nocardioides sp. R-C-SC26]